MDEIKKLLLENKAWAKEQIQEDPNYFKRLARNQTPKILWIGCSDSRVPADKITNTEPGEIFVHRNIANMVVHTDLNMLSVLQYAVNVLKVEHVIVCGHYGCGGIRAALSHSELGLLNKWLRNIKDVYRLNYSQFSALTTPEEKARLMTEVNVREQVLNLAKTSIIQIAWKREQRPQLHGWVYGLEDGIINTLCSMDHNSPLDDIYQYSIDDHTYEINE